jgi:hypothetical protein
MPPSEDNNHAAFGQRSAELDTVARPSVVVRRNAGTRESGPIYAAEENGLSAGIGCPFNGQQAPADSGRRLGDPFGTPPERAFDQ